MRNYIIQRLLLVIPTLLLVTLIVFFAIRMIPGDVIDVMLSEQASINWEADEDTRKMLEKRLGLDVPAHVQYVHWLSNIVLRGDLGKSLWRETLIKDDILRKVPVSIELGIFGIVIGLLISFPIGIYSAIRQDTAGVRDYTVISAIVLLVAVFVVLINLAVDLCYGLVDPRIRYN